MTSAYQDRYFRLPTYELGVPLRYDDVDAQDYAVEEILGCIRFIEEQTGEKFDWDAFFAGLEKYNAVTRFHLELWEINRTRYPQVTGPTPWLFTGCTPSICTAARTSASSAPMKRCARAHDGGYQL